MQELVASTVLKPMITMMSDPDYINQTIVLWVSEQSVGFQTILDLIKFEFVFDLVAHASTWLQLFRQDDAVC